MNLDHWKNNQTLKAKTSKESDKISGQVTFEREDLLIAQRQFIHDLANPLQNILMTIEAIQDGLIENNEQAIDRIKIATEKINQRLEEARLFHREILGYKK